MFSGGGWGIDGRSVLTHKSHMYRTLVFSFTFYILLFIYSCPFSDWTCFFLDTLCELGAPRNSNYQSINLSTYQPTYLPTYLSILISILPIIIYSIYSVAVLYRIIINREAIDCTLFIIWQILYLKRNKRNKPLSKSSLYLCTCC